MMTQYILILHYRSIAVPSCLGPFPTHAAAREYGDTYYKDDPAVVSYEVHILLGVNVDGRDLPARNELERASGRRKGE